MEFVLIHYVWKSNKELVIYFLYFHIKKIIIIIKKKKKPNYIWSYPIGHYSVVTSTVGTPPLLFSQKKKNFFFFGVKKKKIHINKLASHLLDNFLYIWTVLFSFLREREFKLNTYLHFPKKARHHHFFFSKKKKS